MLGMEKEKIEHLPLVRFCSTRYNSIKHNAEVSGYRLFDCRDYNSNILIECKQFGILLRYLKKKRIDLSNASEEEFKVMVIMPFSETVKQYFTIQAIVQAKSEFLLKESSRYKDY